MRKVVLVLGAVAQVFAAWMIGQEGVLGYGLALHVAGAGAWGWGAVALVPGATVAGGGFAGAAALVLPGAGWLVSGVLVFLLRGDPPEPEGRPLMVWSERTVRGDGGLPPVVGTRASVAEILRGPDPAARRHAILALKDLDTRSALPLLRKGLQDSDEQVRIFSQNILSGLLEGFEASIKDYERRADEHPTEVAAVVGLAEQYFELVYLDVAGDEETSAHLLGKAVGLLDRAVEHAPADPRIAMLRLRYALRQRDVTGARAALARVKRLGIDRQMVVPWEAELAFQEGNWAGVREQLTGFRRAGYVNPRIEALAAFWAKGATA